MALNPTDIRVTTYLPQSGYGAGGQHVGLTTSGVIVHHIPSGLGISCDSERSQHANKEKALQLLESLLFSVSSGKAHKNSLKLDTGPQDIAPMTPPDRVRMIKEVRDKSGFGLKESKEAVDKMGTVEGALLHLTGSTGHCNRTWDDGGCLCGGDLPAIREGCYNWQK